MARSKEMTENGELLKYIAKKKHAVIPSGIKTIGRSAFSDELITSVTFPGTVKKIDKGAFFRCRNLKTVEIPDTVTYIGDQAFFQCRSLHKVTLPLSAAHIGRHAFGEYYFFRYVEGLKFPINEYRQYKRFHLLFKTQ